MALPEGFWWGAGSSSSAADGSPVGSDVADWEDRGRLRPSGQGARLATGAPTDLALLAEHGIGHLRYVLDWTRLEPQPGHHDTEAIEEAREVLENARRAGLSVWGCLHDGALPGWFSVDEGGFSDGKRWRYPWARHTEFVAETFGDLVHGWVPTFEPNRWASQGWLHAIRPPGLTDDAKGFAEALEGLLLAGVDAALRLRQDGKPVAAAHWAVPAFAARLQPDTPPSPDAEAMTSVFDEAMFGSWTRLLTEETLVLGGRSPVSVAGAREAYDLVGLTYRHGVAVRGDGALLSYPAGRPIGPDGQPLWAEGLALSLHRLAEALPERALLVAGLGAPGVDEALQDHHLRDLLAVLDEAVGGGIDLRGAWWDTPIDPDASLVAPGLFTVDREPRPAALLWQSVAQGGAVPT